MEFIYGSALLFTAFAVLCIFRHLLSGMGPKQDDEIFDPAEWLAFLLTGVAAFGTAMISIPAFADWSPATAAGLAAALGVTVLACIAFRVLMARFLAARGTTEDSRPIGPSIPDDPRRGRPGSSAAGRGSARQGKRRAA